MLHRIPFVLALLSLSLTGCVAALPMAAQIASDPAMRAQLCSFTKMPGQTSSICDRIPFAAVTQGATRITTR